MNKYLIATLFSFVFCTAVAAQDIGFTCEAKGSDGHVWKYEFEIDKKKSIGVQRGITY
jgi:hypothetical protein